MIKAELEVRNDFDTGKVAHIVQNANKFSSKLTVERHNKMINLKSIMGMISLALLEGDKITLVAEGEDEELALNEIKELL